MLSHNTDFAEVSSLNVIYLSGVDKCGRPVVVVVAKHLPAKSVNLDTLLLYFIHFLDPIVANDYVLIFCAAESSSSNRPGFDWLRRIYSLFKRKYKKNLKGLFIVHPTAWIKSFKTLFTPFVSSKFWRKYHHISDPVGLYSWIERTQLRLPDFVLNYKPNTRDRFGISLEEVLQVTHSKGLIPPILRDCVAYLRHHLDKEGIFRLSGSAAEIKRVIHQYNSGVAVNLDSVADPNVVAGVLKQFLRDLPDPLLPYSIYPQLIATHSALSEPDMLAAWLKNIMSLLSLIPPAHYECLRFLCELIRDTCAASAQNKMTYPNLAICFAPNILKSPETDIHLTVADTPIINACLAQIFEHSAQLLPPLESHVVFQ